MNKQIKQKCSSTALICRKKKCWS